MSDLTAPVVGNLSPRRLRQWCVGEEDARRRSLRFLGKRGTPTIVATSPILRSSPTCSGKQITRGEITCMTNRFGRWYGLNCRAIYV
ncbi:hypothetical protein NPIL_121621 [Nephila pilipes]|uniref:Uncharacterized protein n=1 Tax=Nephila pilipes TaxID=299642 RepID=A0A8X6K894_NEPPI|nr:hypothetical protein NPIL_121621 [Nephila pilipes]